MITTALPGDLLLCRAQGPLSLLINVGEFCRCVWARARGNPWPAPVYGHQVWYWAHVAVVVEDGQTIEAQGRGVVRMAVSDHPEAAVCRAVGLDRERIVAEARRRLGQPYGYRDFFFLSLDAVFGTNFSDNRLGVDICSELGIRCWIAGGYPFEGNPSDVAPSDIAMLVPLGPRP